MFLKNFRIKSNTAIRGSDRRKLRSDVLREFPYFAQELVSDVIPNKEDMSVMKIVTHSGQNVTAYILSGSPIFFQVETKLYPTVYLLWKYPDMLPTFTTWPNVFEKIHGGADLMLPGVILAGNDNLMEFKKGVVCSVTLLGNKAPVAVGYTALSSAEAVENGMRGKVVIILHSYMDQLWSQGTKSNIPVIEPPSLTNNGTACEGSETQTNTVHGTVSDENNLTSDVDGQCPPGSLEDENTLNLTADTHVDEVNTSDDAEVAQQEQAYLPCKEVDNKMKYEEQSSQPTDILTENVTTDNSDPSELTDRLLEGCFLHALLNMKNIDLPMLTSTFYKNYLLPCCPQGQSVDIKKSSYKKLTKFLEVMEKRRFITMKEESKGVHTIDCIIWDNEELRNFKKKTSNLLEENPQIVKELTVDTTYKPPEIEELLAVSGATQSLFKDFGYSKGVVLSAKEVRQVITEYVKCQGLISTENNRKVLLNPALFSVVHKKGEGNIDCLPWDELFTRVIDRMNPCHRVTFTDQTPIIRKGKLEPIDIKVAQRMGNKKGWAKFKEYKRLKSAFRYEKTVTLVQNLEYYGIDPVEFAHKLQLKAASSTAVSQLPGKSTTAQQVLIQGNQIHHVATSLGDDYQIAPKYISGLDKIKQSRQKKK